MKWPLNAASSQNDIISVLKKLFYHIILYSIGFLLDSYFIFHCFFLGLFYSLFFFLLFFFHTFSYFKIRKIALTSFKDSITLTFLLVWNKNLTSLKMQTICPALSWMSKKNFKNSEIKRPQKSQISY